MNLGNHAFRARSYLDGMNGFNAARHVPFSCVGRLLHNRHANRNGSSKRGLKEGEEDEQEWEFHGDVPLMCFPHPGPLPNEREASIPSPGGRGLR
ncbi:hypothetical protein ENT52713_02400 [Enterobacter sp. 200527-13]|nr:hypothetical protein ENT52713_02400 [Enterobacter sp. 200527-13]